MQERKVSINKSAVLIISIYFTSVALMYDVKFILIYFIFYVSVIFLVIFMLLRSIFDLKKNIKNGVVGIVIALLILMVNGCPSIWGSNAYRLSQIIRLEINFKKMQDDINTISPDENGLKFFSAEWDGFMLNGIDIVYDESEEIHLKSELSSPIWTSKSNRLQYKGCYVMPLISHFYLINC